MTTSFLRTRFGCFAFVLLTVGIMTQELVAADSLVDVWLGTGRSKQSQGIYHCTLNQQNGKLSDPTLVAEISGPGFLAMHPSGNVLYAVGSLDGEASVVAYQITGRLEKAALKLMNALPIKNGGAAHVSVDPTGTMLLTAQYGAGSVASFSLADDGSLKAQTALIQHEGGSRVVTGRQDAPHAHWTGFAPDNRFAFVPDLGLDQVVIYQVDLPQAKITPHGTAQAPPGGGPRHMKFHPNGKWAYVLNELSLSVTVYDYDAKAGAMSAKQTVPAVPISELAKEAFKSASEIRIHPSGKFAYSANRGHDTITAYAIDPNDGTLTVIEVENVRGATPRNFNLDPTGQWLLAAGQDSNTLATFAVDQETGELTYHRSIVYVPTAICVLFGHE